MLVDDHKMVCEGLTRLIEFDEEVQVVETANDGVDCLNKIRGAKPDLILLDMNMPEMNGIELLKILNQRKKRPKILALTVHNEIEYLMKVLDLGVEGYILKDCGSKELLRAIHSVYHGERFIQPSLIPLLNSRLIAKDFDQEKIKALSKRELDVLKLVAVGHFNKDIAHLLCISERTVKNHLCNIFRKIDCEDRTQAAVFCIRNGIVSVHD
ncbi:MAG: response regulator transcription factor [Lachnospiraceae bacterium]|nr:response regulator transcription factor [Lachnospiraceae bacterium]